MVARPVVLGDLGRLPEGPVVPPMVVPLGKGPREGGTGAKVTMGGES